MKIKKLTTEGAAGFIVAFIIGCYAFKENLDKQQQEKEFEELKSDVAKLKEAQKESE